MSCVSRERNSLYLMVRVSPNAKRYGVEGIWNGTHLKVALSAPAVDGKANEALVDFLSDYFKVRQSAVQIISGQTARLKRLKIVCDTETVAEKYEKQLNNIA